MGKDSKRRDIYFYSVKELRLAIAQKEKERGKSDWRGRSRTFRSAGGKSKHVGESVLVYCARRPSPPVTYKFNGGREGRKIKRTNLSQSYRLTWIFFIILIELKFYINSLI